jgi:hypothetical protein
MTAFTLLFALALPSWLEPPAGVNAKTVNSENQVETSYTLPMEPVEVAEQLSQLFAKASIAFAANDDGIGLSGRAAAPECDLLVQLRPTSPGTKVRIYCTAKSGSLFGASVTTTNSQPYAATRVSTTSRTKRSGSDGPQLHWPAWLTLIGTTREPEPTIEYVDTLRCLHKQYKVDPPQKTAIFEGYQRLLQSHGYTISKAVDRPGKTISGRTVENYYAHVEGFQSSDGTRQGAHSVIKATFSRHSMVGYVPVAVAICAGRPD